MIIGALVTANIALRLQTKIEINSMVNSFEFHFKIFNWRYR